MNNAKNYVVLLGYLENDPTTKDDDVYYVHDPSDIKNNKVSFKDIQLGLSFKKMWEKININIYIYIIINQSWCFLFWAKTTFSVKYFLSNGHLSIVTLGSSK